MHIVVTGNPADGFRFIGPFPNSAEAVEFAGKYIHAEWWVAPLDPKHKYTAEPLDRYSDRSVMP